MANFEKNKEIEISTGGYFNIEAMLQLTYYTKHSVRA